jgi:hypothetical protein
MRTPCDRKLDDGSPCPERARIKIVVAEKVGVGFCKAHALGMIHDAAALLGLRAILVPLPEATSHAHRERRARHRPGPAQE